MADNLSGKLLVRFSGSLLGISFISMYNRAIYNIIIAFEIQLDKIKPFLQQCSVRSMQKLTNLRGVN